MLALNNQNRIFWAVAQLFLALSLVFGTWIIYIPHITNKLQISEGQLGICLFAGALGSLAATLIGKSICQQYGEGKIALYSIISKSAFTIALFVAPSFYSLGLALFLFGFCGGLFQISANALVIEAEKRYRISIMAKCHGFFSLGALVASGLGTLLIMALDNPVLHVCLSAGLVVLLQLIFSKQYLPINSLNKTQHETPSCNTKRNGILFWLALISISAMVTEGAIADWSGLYLQNIILTPKQLTGLGYAGFSFSMTIGRLLGDYFSKRYGPLQIIIGGFILSLFGFLLVFYPNTYIVIIGFIIIGAGFSIIVPEVYRVSANIPGVNASSGIAFIAASSYVGFLGGPVLLGFIAESFGLSVSFMAMFALVSVGTLTAIKIKTATKLQQVCKQAN